VSPRRSSSTTGGPYRKPRANLYTALLAIALVALLLGILCLYLELNDYQWKFKGGPTVPPLPQAAAPVHGPEPLPLGPGAALAEAERALRGLPAFSVRTDCSQPAPSARPADC